MSHIANKTFGVELEFTVPYEVSGEDVARAMETAGVACSYSGYTHRLTSHWKVVTDASVRGGLDHHGYEIVSPILTDAEGFAQIEKVCAVLATLNARVNASCGLHVHVGASAMSIGAMKALAKIYAECEDVIDSVMPHSRRASNNTYCRPVKGVRWERLATATSAADIAEAINGGGRYCKLNYAAHRKHGTVEFRHHAGTVDANKVCKWIHACLRMVATAQKEANNVIAVTVNRPVINNARLRKIYEMVCRDQGASREEIAAMLSRRTAPPVAKILTNAALPFTVRRGRYYANVTSTPAPLPGQVVVNSLQDFATRMEMPADELLFWVGRHTAVNSANAMAA